MQRLNRPVTSGVRFALTDEQKELRAVALRVRHEEIRRRPPSTTCT